MRFAVHSYELPCNAISDERGSPRVMSCLAATLRLRFLHAGYALGRNDRNKKLINPWRCEQYTERAERCEGAYLEVSD